VDIRRTQSTPPQLTPIHQRYYFLMRQEREPVEVLEEDQHTIALLDRPKRQFLDHSRMTSDQVVTEKRNKRRLGGMEVVNPDRSIDQDHLAPSRRRGAAVAWLSEPPRAAKRLALSTRIRVSSPSRKSADLSVMPVNSAARAKSSSSIVTVVLIEASASKIASSDALNDATSWVMRTAASPRRPDLRTDYDYTLKRNSTTSPSRMT
jgi:hypothetical protein